MRPIALGGFSGGLASALVSLLNYQGLELRGDPTGSPVCPIPVFGETTQLTPWHLDFKSVVIGICIGLLLGPILEVLVVLRQLWALQLRAWFRVPVQHVREPYRILG